MSISWGGGQGAAMQLHNWPGRGRVSTEKMAPVRRLPGGQPRQRNIGSCPCSIRPGTTHFSLFSYAFCASPAADLPLQPRVSVCQRVSLRAGPLRSASGARLGFQVSSISPTWSQSSLIFTIVFCLNSFPGTGTLACGGPV